MYIYLDYQATTPTDPEVFKAMSPYFSDKFFTQSSSQPGKDVNQEIESCRYILSQAINARPNEILFTSGATESINNAIKGLFEHDNKGHIVTVKTEHSAVLNTCRYLEKKGIAVTYLNVEENGLVNLQKLEEAITEHTKLVAVMQVNNEIGVIQPIEEIGKICALKKVPFLVDAAQSFGKMHIDVLQSNISMLAISGHKIYGPKGIGALYVNNSVKNEISPLLHGGGQEYGLRSGTLNIAGIVGLAKATEIAVEKMPTEQVKILSLRNLLLNLIQKEVNDVAVNGDMHNRIAGNLNLSFQNVSGDVLLNRLEKVILSRGSACNALKNQGSHVLNAIGLSDDLSDSAIRISIGRYTTEEEIVLAAETISTTVNNIRKISTLA